MSEAAGPQTDPNAARLGAALASAADRLGRDLAAALGAPVSVTAAEAVTATAAGLLPRIGPAVVAAERTVTGAGTLLVLASSAAAARLAALGAGAAPAGEPPPFDVDRDRAGLAKVIDAVAATAVAILAGGADLHLAPERPGPKAFDLAQDLNRAVGFLGDGTLAGARLSVSAGGGTAEVVILARPDLAAALAARLPAAAPAAAPPAADQPPPDDLRRILTIAVPVIATLAEKKMTVAEVLELAVGKVLEFDKSADDLLDLLVNNRTIGRGEAVKVGDKFGLRIFEIGDVRDTIRKLGESEPPPVV